MTQFNQSKMMTVPQTSSLPSSRSPIANGRTIVLFFALLIAGCGTRPVAENSAYDDDRPKYGDAHYETLWSRTPADQQAGLESSSIDASKRGWSLLLQGDFPTAMKRFNQAWTLHPQNANALWGMAIVRYEQIKHHGGQRRAAADLSEMDEAVLLIEEAIALPTPEASLINDTAMLVMTRGGMRKWLAVDGSVADFARAETLLQRAGSQGVNPLIYDNWAALARYRDQPALAEQYAEKARKLRSQPASR